MAKEQRRFIRVHLTLSELKKIIGCLDFARAGQAIEEDKDLNNYLTSLCNEE